MIRVFLTLACLFTPLVVSAQEASMPTIFPAGGQVGTTFTVAPEGKALPEVKGLFFSRPGITAVKLKGNQFTVTIDPKMPTGDVEVWANTAKGLSNPRRFTIGDLPEVVEKEPNDSLKNALAVTAPVVVNGTLAPGADRDLLKLEVKVGQRLTFHFRSETLDGSARPALTILDADGKEILHSDGRDAEPMIDVEFKTAGVYYVQLDERSFQTGDNSVYRLAILDGPCVVGAFPPVLNRGKTQPVTLYGYRLPGGKVIDPKSPDRLEELAVQVAAPNTGDADGGGWLPSAASLLEGFRYQHPGCYGWVRFGITDDPIVIEEKKPHSSQNEALLTSIPGVIVGQWMQGREVDWYRLDAKKGALVWIETVGERAGKTMDVEAALHDAKGMPVLTPAPPGLAKGETPPLVPNKTADAYALWKVAEDGPHFLAVRDFFGSTRWGPTRSYQVNITPRREEVCVMAVPGANLALTPGSKAALTLFAIRRGGHEGEIRIRPANAVPGIDAAPVVIPPKELSVVLNLEAKKDAADWFGLLPLVAETTVNGKQQILAVVPMATVRPGVVRRSLGIAASVGK